MLSVNILNLFCHAADIGTATALGTSEGVSNRDPLHDADEFRVLGRIESIPAARPGFSSRRPLGGCERGGVWIIPTGRRKRIRTLFSRNTNSRQRDLTASLPKKTFCKSPSRGRGGEPRIRQTARWGSFLCRIRHHAPGSWNPAACTAGFFFCVQAMTDVLKRGICPISRTAGAIPPSGQGRESIPGRGPW